MQTSLVITGVDWCYKKISITQRTTHNFTLMPFLSTKLHKKNSKKIESSFLQACNSTHYARPNHIHYTLNTLRI